MTLGLTVKEAASQLKVSPARVYQLISQGMIQAERFGSAWAIDAASVAARAASSPKAGRPASQKPNDKPCHYWLMNREHAVLKFAYSAESGMFTASSDIADAARAPLGVTSPRGARVSNTALAYWWKHRAIPQTRDGLTKRLTELGVENAAAIPFKSLGLSLSDQYWVRPEGTDIRWEDINFFHNDFAFDEDGSWMASTGLESPDNTSEGQLPKRWIIRNGVRVLVKGAGPLGQEPFNEVVATKLYERLLPAESFVPYTLCEAAGAPASLCPCFIRDNEEYIPAHYVRQIMRKPNHLSDYRHFIECCARLGIDDAEETLSHMIVCDDLIANHDRHWRNFGIIRNVETLKCHMAPLFDAGSSLWCDVPTAALATQVNTFSAKPFYEDANRQLRLVDDYSWLNLRALDGFAEQAASILMASPELATRAPLIQKGIQHRIDHIVRMLD